MQVENLSRFELQMLGRFLLYRMPMDTRGKLMAELPVVYRKLLGKEDTPEFREAVKDVVLDRKPETAASFSELWNGDSERVLHE